MEEYKDILVKLSIYSTFCKHTGDLEGSALTSKAYDVIRKLSYKYEKALSDLVKESNSKRQCPVCGRENCFVCAYCGADMRIESYGWIPTAERLPDPGKDVFVYLFHSNSPYIAWVNENGEWETEDFLIDDPDDNPIAWMPLPEPPKEETC